MSSSRWFIAAAIVCLCVPVFGQGDSPNCNACFLVVDSTCTAVTPVGDCSSYSLPTNPTFSVPCTQNYYFTCKVVCASSQYNSQCLVCAKIVNHATEAVIATCKTVNQIIHCESDSELTYTNVPLVAGVTYRMEVSLLPCDGLTEGCEACEGKLCKAKAGIYLPTSNCTNW